MGLIQASFKLLLLPWVSEHETYEILCASFKSGVSISHNTLVLLALPLTFKFKYFGDSSSRCRIPGLGIPMWAWTPCSLGRTSVIVIIHLFECSLPMDIDLDYISSLPLQPISFWFLFISLAVEYLLCLFSGCSHG